MSNPKGTVSEESFLAATRRDFRRRNRTLTFLLAPLMNETGVRIHQI
jgi:hypothetical protein